MVGGRSCSVNIFKSFQNIMRRFEFILSYVDVLLRERVGLWIIFQLITFFFASQLTDLLLLVS